jgi:hypothetical protein
MRAVKLDWSSVPSMLHVGLADMIGDHIRVARPVDRGFGRSACFIVESRNGRRYFSKVTHPGDTPMGQNAFLREEIHYRAFPELAAFGPTYRGSIARGDWKMLVLDWIESAFDVPPWSEPRLGAVLQALARFHAGTPSRAAAMLERAEEFALFNVFNRPRGWATLATDRSARERFLSLFAEPEAAASWFAAQSPTLVEHEASSTSIGGPRAWVHQDIRSDNLLFNEPDQVRFVDWPFLAFGPVVMDVAFLAPSVEAEGGPPPEVTMALYQQASGQRLDSRALRIASATIAGFFAIRAGEPELEGLPRLRWIQRRQLIPALAWACRLLGGEPPLFKSTH